MRGFKRAIFSGFTTAALADVIGDIIADHPRLRGVWHVAAEPINKFDLLTLVKRRYELDIEIEPDEDFRLRPQPQRCAISAGDRDSRRPHGRR